MSDIMRQAMKNLDAEDAVRADPRNVNLRVTPQQPRALATLEKLRAAAVEVYNDPAWGRDKLTTKEVGLRAGVAEGTVYRFWKNRIEVLDDIAPHRDQTPVGP
jgi:hypothetical protein